MSPLNFIARINNQFNQDFKSFTLGGIVISLLVLVAPFSLKAAEGAKSEAKHENIEYYHKLPPASENAQRPSIPKLVSPAPLSEVEGSNIELKWNKIEEATAYALQVSPDPIFFQLIVNEPLYKETSYKISNIKFESGKHYYWRVASVKEENQPGTIKSLFNRSSFTVK